MIQNEFSISTLWIYVNVFCCLYDPNVISPSIYLKLIVENLVAYLLLPVSTYTRLTF